MTASGESLSAAPREGVDLPLLWRVGWSYRFLIIGITLLFMTIAVVLALSATPIYRAQVVVTEAQRESLGAMGSLGSQLGGLASLVGVSVPSGGATAEAKAVLESRALAQEFVKRHVDLQQFLPSPKPPRTLWRGVERFRSKVLSISEDLRKSKTTVTIDWTDAATAARWANDYVALANEILRTRAIDESTRNLKYLNDQIAKTDVIEVRRVMYNVIETETNRLMLANGRTEYAFTVVDAAVVPEMRRSPQRTLMVLVGALIGIIAGTVVAFVHHALARRPVVA